MADSQRHSPRLVAAMVSDAPTLPRERRRLREILAPAGRGSDSQIAELARAVRTYRESRQLAATDPRRAETLKQLGKLEKLAGDLHSALSAIGLDASARIEDVPGPDMLELQETGNRAFRLHAAAAAARHQLSLEGAKGGAPGDDSAIDLVTVASRIWSESGGRLTRGWDKDLSPWETFACALLALARCEHPTSRSGLRLARTVAEQAPD